MQAGEGYGYGDIKDPACPTCDRKLPRQPDSAFGDCAADCR